MEFRQQLQVSTEKLSTLSMLSYERYVCYRTNRTSLLQGFKLLNECTEFYNIIKLKTHMHGIYEHECKNIYILQTIYPLLYYYLDLISTSEHENLITGVETISLSLLISKLEEKKKTTKNTKYRL